MARRSQVTGQAAKQAAGKPRRRRSRDAPAAEPARFQAERQALGKIQLHFEFRQSLLRKVRLAAATANLSYSDYVRQAVGLPLARAQRPRISLSFSAADLAALAERYGQPREPNVLKRCVMAEINERLGSAGEDAEPRAHAGRAPPA